MGSRKENLGFEEGHFGRAVLKSHPDAETKNMITQKIITILISQLHEH